MNLIKISTDLELSVHEFPTGTHEEQNSTYDKQREKRRKVLCWK